MKKIKKMKNFILFALIFTSFNINAQLKEGSGKNILQRPLKNINYMSANSRLGYGLGTPTLSTKNNWNVNPGGVIIVGLGYNFVIKNSWGFDIQINYETASFEINNAGPTFKTGYSSTGAELGIKKIFPSKPDDTFFIRAAAGYNFLNIADKSGSNDFYNYNSSSSGANIYVMPELGYQLRLKSGNQIIDFCAQYKYSLSDVGSTYMVFTDKGNSFEENTALMSGNYFGISIRYSYLFKGFEKKGTTTRIVDELF